MLLIVATGCTAPRQPEGASCIFNDDCRSPMICVARRCRVPCRDMRDCVSPYVCTDTETPGVRVCMPPTEPTPCLYSTECGDAGICCFGECRATCSAGVCPVGMIRDPSNRCVAFVPMSDGGVDISLPDAPPMDAFDAPTDSATDVVAMDAPPADAPDVLPTDAGRVPPFVEICAGLAHTCGLTRAGAVWCWGDDRYGALGRGTEPTVVTPLPDPQPVAGLSDVVSITCGQADSTGGNFTCALIRDGTVRCWGQNFRQALGVATPAMSGAPLTVPGVSNVVQIAAGGSFACALRSSADVLCWGAAYIGQIGSGTILGNMLGPSMTLLGDRVREVRAGRQHACARGLTSGLMYCWGNNGNSSFSGLLNGREFPFPVPVEFPTAAPESYTSFAIGAVTNCGVLPSGGVQCWGGNSAGMAGLPSGLAMAQPTTVAGVAPARMVSPGPSSSCAVLTDGRVQCWGTSPLGDGMSTGARVGPVLSLTNIATVVAGAAHRCALDADGYAWCWGANATGQCGVAGLMPVPTPLRVQ